VTTKTQGINQNEWLLSTGNGQISHDQATVTVAGGVLLPSGTVLGKVTASGKYIKHADAANDGSQAACAILSTRLDGTDIVNGDYPAVIFTRECEATLTARLAYFAAVSGGLLACLPLELKLRGKSTAQSFGKPVFFVDLVVRPSMTLEEAITQAKEVDGRRKASGFDQAALDEAARAGFERGVFEDEGDEGGSVAEEFFPGAEVSTSGSEPATAVPANKAAGTARVGLREKLDARATVGQGSAT
jgi:hypothetical protein